MTASDSDVVNAYNHPRYRKVQDSGKREQYGTGAVRDTDEGKPRYELIPVAALRRVAQHYANGARKYSDRNWEKGIPISRCYAGALRHLYAFQEGEADEDHLSAVVFNVLAIIHFYETGRTDLDDLHTPPIHFCTGLSVADNVRCECQGVCRKCGAIFSIPPPPKYLSCWSGEVKCDNCEERNNVRLAKDRFNETFCPMCKGPLTGKLGACTRCGWNSVSVDCRVETRGDLPPHPAN